MVSPDTPQRPLVQLQLGGSSPPSAGRHETVVPAEPDDVARALHAALEHGNDDERGAALRAIVAGHPTCLEGWARLSELTLSDDPVTAYAFARVAYHRGLDRLRRHGWGGTGLVHWEHESNRGVLRGVHALLAAAAALGEEDEAARCRTFLLELDPTDALGIATYPEAPGPSWRPPQLP